MEETPLLPSQAAPAPYVAEAEIMEPPPQETPAVDDVPLMEEDEKPVPKVVAAPDETPDPEETPVPMTVPVPGLLKDPDVI